MCYASIVEHSGALTIITADGERERVVPPENRETVMQFYEQEVAGVPLDTANSTRCLWSLTPGRNCDGSVLPT